MELHSIEQHNSYIGDIRYKKCPLCKKGSEAVHSSLLNNEHHENKIGGLKMESRELLEIVSKDKPNPVRPDFEYKAEMGKWHDALLEKIFTHPKCSLCGVKQIYIRRYGRNGTRLNGEFVCPSCGTHHTEGL